MHHIKPIITKQNGKQKPGKGFSPNELKQAGITKQHAKQIGLPIDQRRKSTHPENIKTIKAHSELEKTESMPKITEAAEKPKKKAKS